LNGGLLLAQSNDPSDRDRGRQWVQEAAHKGIDTQHTQHTTHLACLPVLEQINILRLMSCALCVVGSVGAYAVLGSWAIAAGDTTTALT
jgi:hypothetical protein